MLVLRNKKLFDEAEAFRVNFDDVSLSNVSSYKYLGVDLNRNLTGENAVHDTYIKANKK